MSSKKKIKRALADSINRVSKSFKVLLLTGPRQVGKTTLLKQISAENRSYVTLDDLTQRAAAIDDPAGFIERLTLPVLIDEVQYAPNLFPYIKICVDNSDKRGQFWLTGSQQFEMMKNVSESLAGRVGILQLQGISLAEEQERETSEAFLPELALLRERSKTAKRMTLKQVFGKIWRGSYPDVVTQKGENWEHFYESYVSTYIQKDIQDYLGINNKAAFLKFMQVAAARTGQLLNYADMARDVGDGTSEVTIKSWINALEASGIIYLLKPYFMNTTKRLIKSPKLYFMDTGLCAFLTGWLSPDVLERGAMSGAFLETYVVSEIIKSYIHNGRIARIYFYRDKEKREIDVIIEQNGKIYPIEIKKTATPNKSAAKSFQCLKHLAIPVGHGGVMCFTSSLAPLDTDIDAIPIWYL